MTGRIDDLQGVNLMAGGTVFDGTITAGIGGDVTAYAARIAAARIAGIEQAAGFRGGLQIGSTHPRFDDGVQAVRTDFTNMIQSFRTENDTAIDGDGATGQSRAAAAGNDGNVTGIGQFYYGGRFVRRGRQHHRFGEVVIGGIRHFIMTIWQHLFPFRQDIGGADNLS